ncbi:rRNA methyltransferase [Streptomyces sp. RKND-216]|uniref:small ribosomal subunit Rsm22 family protein n=1 Tax=Streptomyces sp. RKND-216 TaxID=2562581 RepID=UPI00109DBC23|nr:small ribosomal subunit Rsm22 family protein [Streptomyces sp. RKND-216]THA26669.1 rRNA methyltransferase [Streptomyces sp. RKND-216]
MQQASSPGTAESLRVALDALVDGLPPRRATSAVERLIGHYRGATPTHAPILRDRADVVAYAAYRMPATYEAVAAALRALAVRVPGWSPESHLDLGGGTGAAVWAADAVWGDGPPGGPTRGTTVLDWSEPALALGRDLAAQRGSAAPAAAEWRRQRLAGDAALPPADLVSVGYVLNELAEADRGAVIEAAARAARGAVLVVEPGTPDGYARMIEARGRLVAAGLTVLAPCPHSGRCPIVPGEDWCHFAARVSRSSLHRRVKGGTLPYEDEKFAYVAAVTPGLLAGGAGGPASARIVRKPQIRKGQVLLDLCTEGEGLCRTTVSKRHGADYRAARNADWGDAWPPPGPTG